MTAGVDVQRDRLEIVFLGHGRDDVFLLGNSVIWGDPNGDDVWAELEDALRTIWKHPAAAPSGWTLAEIDAGDGETMDRVIAFAGPRFGRRVVAIKGAPGNRPAIMKSATKGQKLFIVGVDGLKTQLAARLARGRSVRLSKSLEPRVFEELASERHVVKYQKGRPVRVWERIPGRRAECLDATVYGIAVRHLVNVDLERRAAELADEAPARPVPGVIRSRWLAR